MVATNTNVKSWVISMTSVFLTLQVLGLAGTTVFYLFASSDKYRDDLARPIMRALYHRHQWDWLRGEHALELHILISGAIQLALFFPTILLVMGVTKRIRWLMLPWLTLFGVAQILLMAAILACVIYLPTDLKPLAMAVTAVEAFILFPWWYGVIHLFAVYDSQHVPAASYLVYPTSSSTSELYHKPYSLGGRTTTYSHNRSMEI